MDAQAYLMRHGWSGPGNPLNANQRPGLHGGLGLTRPILVARKQNNHGVGKKTTKDATNQWWLRGFEDALKGFDEESPAETAETGNALTSELYRFFVRGQGLAGTLDRETIEASDKSKAKAKRKRDSEDEEERRARKEEKAARKEEKSKRRKVKGDRDVAESAAVSLNEKEERRESKEERRARRKEKKEKKESRGSGDSSVDEDSNKALKKSKKSKRSTSEEDYPTPMSTEQELDQGQMDTTDDAAEQAKAKKERKESKKSKEKDSESREADTKKKSKKDKKEKKSSSG